MCKKQTSVSHSSTEAEIISQVYAEPRRNLSANTQPNMRKQTPTHTNLDLTNIDHVSSNVKPSGSSAMLQVFENNEAVIKMIITSRSPTMRHVSRTHRVALGLVVDTITLDSKIQIKYIDTKHQLADILTKGNFTRDEWNNLLYLLNISPFSSTSCAKISSLISCPKTMAKRMQEQKDEERSVAKSKSTATNLSSHVLTSSSSVNHPIASKSPGILTAKKFKTRRSVEFSSGLQDAYLGGLMDRVAGKLAATDESQEFCEFCESESWSNHEKEVTGKPVAHENVTGKLVASRNLEDSGNPNAGNKKWPHIFHLSSAVVPHMESLFDLQKDLRPKPQGQLG